MFLRWRIQCAADTANGLNGGLKYRPFPGLIGLHWEREKNMAQQERTKTIVPPNSPERWGGVDPKPPPHFDEPKDPVLLEYVHGGRTAIITFNRPQAGNTVTTALGVRFAEIMEDIEAKVTARCAIVTGAGQDFAAAPICANAKPWIRSNG